MAAKQTAHRRLARKSKKQTTGRDQRPSAEVAASVPRARRGARAVANRLLQVRNAWNAGVAILKAWADGASHELIERGWRKPLRPQTRHQLGQLGEKLAARQLRRAGCRILFRSYQSPLGEIDLIALEKRRVLFVEVKTRQDLLGALPTELVAPVQQQRIRRSAAAFLKRRGLAHHPHRFDIITVQWPASAAQPVVRHHRNAF